MSNDDITVEILKDIREEIRATRQDLTQEMQKTNSRLDAHIVETRTGMRELSTRILASEMRTATAINELAGTMHDVRDLLKDKLDLRDRVERCEHDIAELKRRL